jgi:hypothetical protein
MWNLPSFEFLIMFYGVPKAAQENANMLSVIIMMAN